MKRMISNGKLSIVLDEDHLNNNRDLLLEKWDEELKDSTAYKFSISQKEYEKEIERLYSLANDIMTSTHIFDHIPTTKSGYFHKTRTVLVSDSKAKFLDEYGMKGVALKLRQRPYNDRGWEDIPTGNGIEMYLEMDWFDLKPSEQSLYDPSGHIKKIVTRPRVKYIQLTELKPGFLYETKQGQAYLYLGVRNLYAIPKIPLGPNESIYTDTFWWNHPLNIDNNCAQMCVVKYTKSVEKQLSGCETISDVFQVLSDAQKCKGHLKREVEMQLSLKFAKCLGQLVEDDQKDQVISYMMDGPHKIRNDSTGLETSISDPIQLDQHIMYHQDSSDFTENQKGDLRVFLSSKSLKDAYKLYLMYYRDDGSWGSTKSEWIDEWKNMEAKIQELIEDHHFIDRLPLKRNGTFPELTCIWKSKFANRSSYFQFGIYLYAYNVREMLEVFSGTSIPMVPHKMACLYITPGSMNHTAGSIVDPEIF